MRGRPPRSSAALPRRSYCCGSPAMPQWAGATPWTSTWMCSRAAPDDSASAAVIASMIFGSDSSVTPLSQIFTSTIGISASSFVPWFAVPAPPVRVVAFHDHPGVLLQLGCLQHVEERLGQPVDQRALELGRQPPFEELDADERHQRATCSAPAASPSTRSRSLSGTWSSGTGASASMNVTPFAE